MGKVLCCALIPVLLAACANPMRSLPDSVKSQKSACAGGNYTICSDIGHEVREAEGGPATPTEPFVLNQPIVD
jgi:hypothetical protein